MRPLLWQKGDACYYCASLIMQVNGEVWKKGDVCYYCVSPSTQVGVTHVARGASPFITKAGASPIPYIERWALEWRVSISCPPYKACLQLGQNSGGSQYCPVLTISFPFWTCSLKILWWWSIILVRVGLLLPYSFCFCPLYRAPIILTIIGI
jgi:hypothetical protein